MYKNRLDHTIILEIISGVGIEENKQDQIFSKYFRLENNIPGSGIGLYLVNEIVKNTGGKITVESQKGIGSTFKVFLQADHDLKNDPEVMKAALEKSKTEIQGNENTLPG